MGFNQFMLLESATDYTVKYTGQTGGRGSINLGKGDSEWNTMALRLVFSFLNLYEPQVEDFGTVCCCILHASL